MNLELILYVSLGSFLGTLLVTLFQSYFTEKGKNLATKQDIESITKKIEDVKDPYNRSMENLKNELKKAYDLSKPSLDHTIEIDKTLIDKISNLNSTVFEFSQLKLYDTVLKLLDEINDLSIFLVKYKTRYKNLGGVEEIVNVRNTLTTLNGEHPINLKEIERLYIELSINLDKLMSYFLVPIQEEKKNSCH